MNALVAGDWEVAWTLTILTGATASHVYTITVTSTAASGVTSTLYTFTFTSPASISNGQTMTILWDTERGDMVRPGGDSDNGRLGVIRK